MEEKQKLDPDNIKDEKKIEKLVQRQEQLKIQIVKLEQSVKAVVT